jgi:excinuclease UvrABC ATPase subunit
MGANVRSTVGTATDANAMLRILFSRLGKPRIGSPVAFSFNVPTRTASGALTVDKGKGEKVVVRDLVYQGGMCPRCEGRGSASDIDRTALYDETKSLNEGALPIPGFSMDGWYGRIFRGCGYFDPDKPIRKYTKKELDDLLYREAIRIKVEGVNLTYEGLIPTIGKKFLAKDVDTLQPHIRAFVERAVTFTDCPDCGGTRLNEAARSSKINGINIAEASAMQITDLADWIRGLAEPSVAPLLTALGETLDSFVEIGLGYLSLDRPTGTLSGGEAQRTKMIRHLGSSLTDVTYVFDEPTVGLHPHDIRRMNELLLQLRDKGNTVLVVEHKPEAIAIADHVVDLGPGAGTAGGSVCFEGTVAGLRGSDTLTGRHLDDRAAVKQSVRTATGALEVRGASTHNLQSVDVDIPLGVLVVITGVAGSGKSSLVRGSVAGRDGVVTVDQTAIKGSRRSNPATYTGLLDPIRKAFAKANGVNAALFSANSEGACPGCNGAGVIYTDLAVMAGVATTCEECGGQRYQAAVLEYRFGGKNISEVLAMPVIEAQEFFGAGEAKTPAAAAVLDRLADVGLGYLSLGQPLPTLSGGERQRLKLATRMAEKGGIYVLDEPTSGLHLADVEQLLGLLDRLVDAGKSVIVIEHHQAVMAHADWLIDLGPGAGHDGGRIVFEGTPAELVAARSTVTGEHLAAYVGAT